MFEWTEGQSRNCQPITVMEEILGWKRKLQRVIEELQAKRQKLVGGRMLPQEKIAARGNRQGD